MNQIRLSICIPTYNRAKYLEQTLASILRQVGEEILPNIEICVSDNASTDGTEALIHQLQQSQRARIVYSRNEKNEGADRNYMRAIELAGGEYCWFMGSDDLLNDGALARMLEQINSGHEIYLCDRIECDIEMQRRQERHWLPRIDVDKSFRLDDKKEFLHYLGESQSIGALFSYLSSIIFKRANWERYPLKAGYIGTAYSHAYRLLSFIKEPCVLTYIRDPLILCRGQNDSFESEGIVRRVMLDIDGYKLLAGDFFSDDAELKSAFLQVLKRERPPLSTLTFVRLRTDAPTWRKLESSFRSAQYPWALLKVIGHSKGILQLMKRARRLAA